MKPQERTRAILDSKVEPTWRFILVAIADHMGPDDRCWLRPETVAKDTGYALSTVNTALAEMEDAGVLRRWWGGHRAKDHAIAWDALASAQPKATKRGGANRRRSPNIGDESPNTGDPNTGDNSPNIGNGSPNIGDQSPNIGPPNIGDESPNIGSWTSEHRYGDLRTSVEALPNIGPEPLHEPSREPLREPPPKAGAGARGPKPDTFADPADVVLDSGNEIPGRLSDLLAEMHEMSPQRVIARLLMVPVESTRALLELSRGQWYGAEGRCYVTGCASLRGPLDRYLQARWGVGLGALATTHEAPRHTRTGPSFASVLDELGEGPPRRNAIDAEVLR